MDVICRHKACMHYIHDSVQHMSMSVARNLLCKCRGRKVNTRDCSSETIASQQLYCSAQVG